MFFLRKPQQIVSCSPVLFSDFGCNFYAHSVYFVHFLIIWKVSKNTLSLHQLMLKFMSLSGRFPASNWNTAASYQIFWRAMIVFCFFWSCFLFKEFKLFLRVNHEKRESVELQNKKDYWCFLIWKSIWFYRTVIVQLFPRFSDKAKTFISF